MSTNSRKQCTGGDPCDVRSLAEAIYCALHHSDLSLPAIAETIGVRSGYLMDSANPDREDTQFQARLIPAVTRVTRNAALIEYLARECGGVFVATPFLAAGHTDITAQTAAILREVADVIQAPAAALANDGRIDARECAAMEKQIDEAVAALLAFKSLLRAKAGISTETVPVTRRARR